MSLFTLITLLKALSLNTVTWRVRASTYWREHNSVHNRGTFQTKVQRSQAEHSNFTKLRMQIGVQGGGQNFRAETTEWELCEENPPEVSVGVSLSIAEMPGGCKKNGEL